MSASKYDFSIEQGTSFKLAFVYKNADGDPINLANWCARIVWKTNNNTTQIFSSDNVNLSQYRFTIDDANGKLVLLLPSTTTNEFNFNTAKYDLELVSNDNFYALEGGVGGGKYSIRLLYGTVTMIKRFSQNSTALEC
jgi:hypothetical protein